MRAAIGSPSRRLASAMVPARPGPPAQTPSNSPGRRRFARAKARLSPEDARARRAGPLRLRQARTPRRHEHRRHNGGEAAETTAAPGRAPSSMRAETCPGARTRFERQRSVVRDISPVRASTFATCTARRAGFALAAAKTRRFKNRTLMPRSRRGARVQTRRRRLALGVASRTGIRPTHGKPCESRATRSALRGTNQRKLQRCTRPGWPARTCRPALQPG